MVANFLPADTPPPYYPDPMDGVSMSKFTFSEHGHVTYQIKENQECTNMVANSFRTDPSIPLPVLWIGSVGHNSIFSEQSPVTYRIKENQECTNMVANILLFAPRPTTPPPTLGMGSVGQNTFFKNMDMLHIKIKENHECSHMVSNTLRADPHTPDPENGVSRSKFTFIRTWSCCISN